MKRKTKLDSFLFSSEIKDDNYDNIEWQSSAKYKLKTPLTTCGYILYKCYIITFGGYTLGGKYIDAIYILDLESDIGWIELEHTNVQYPLCIWQH